MSKQFTICVNFGTFFTSIKRVCIDVVGFVLLEIVRLKLSLFQTIEKWVKTRFCEIFFFFTSCLFFVLRTRARSVCPSKIQQSDSSNVSILILLSCITLFSRGIFWGFQSCYFYRRFYRFWDDYVRVCMCVCVSFVVWMCTENDSIYTYFIHFGTLPFDQYDISVNRSRFFAIARIIEYECDDVSLYYNWVCDCVRICFSD